jgi:hypothetical protein
MTDRENREPNLLIPKTEREDPIRMKLRMDKDEPREVQSITEMDDPSRE